jgi:hypothetical protein
LLARSGLPSDRPADRPSRVGRRAIEEADLPPFGPSPAPSWLVESIQVQQHVEVRQMKRVVPFLFTAFVVSIAFALVALMTTHRGEELRSELAKIGRKVSDAAKEELGEAVEEIR